MTYTEREMRAAFKAGFNESAEGFNGEYVRHPETLNDTLDELFDEYLRVGPKR